MAATTRESISPKMPDGSNAPFVSPVSNDTEVDMEVARIADEQKRETGMSESDAAIKARVLADGFNRKVVTPGSQEEDMRLGHIDTLKAKKVDLENLRDVEKNSDVESRIDVIDSRISDAESASAPKSKK